MKSSKTSKSVDVHQLATFLRGVELLQRSVLSGGDDYELCFTAPAAHHENLQRISAQLDLPLTCTGKIVAGRGCIVQDANGKPLHFERSGYDHFR